MDIPKIYFLGWMTSGFTLSIWLMFRSLFTEVLYIILYFHPIFTCRRVQTQWELFCIWSICILMWFAKIFYLCCIKQKMFGHYLHFFVCKKSTMKIEFFVSTYKMFPEINYFWHLYKTVDFSYMFLNISQTLNVRFRRLHYL